MFSRSTPMPAVSNPAERMPPLVTVTPNDPPAKIVPVPVSNELLFTINPLPNPCVPPTVLNTPTSVPLPTVKTLLETNVAKL
ncbi:MAG: hypothetical protein PCFJNLEI_04226 [Verrucomicrobiae bacterium]|nr:hypothetical protein [Verrucomicrobiae bacterium]